jgi:hypothetical protein
MTSFITQPTYLPWVGIFKAIDYVDTFVFYDDVQFERHSWQNRNRVLDSARPAPACLTVPVAKHHIDTPIRDIKLADPEFGEEHLRKLTAWYPRAPFLAQTLAVLQTVYSERHVRLAELTSALTIALAKHIGITASFRYSHDFGISGDKYSRPLAFVRALGSTVYLTQAGTRSYTDLTAFRAHGIDVVFLDFQHPVYRQPRAPFTPYLSIVDLLMNIGPEEAAALIRGIKLDGDSPTANP